MVGGLHENAISRKLLSSSIPYYQDDLTWCLQPASLASTLFNVFVVFNTLIWSACITIIISSAIIFFVNSYFETPRRINDNPSFSLILSTAIMFNTNIGYLPNRMMIKLFLAILLIFAFHFGAFYNAFLLKILTSPRYEPQISNTYMAVKYGMTFNGNEDTLAHFQEKEDSISKQILKNFNVCLKLDECLENIKKSKTTTVAVSRHHAMNSPVISPLEMFCFTKSNNIYTYSVTMLVKKQYHLLLKIENIIRGITESGLLSKWQRDSELVVVSKDSDEEGGVMRLKFEHVQGGFLLWGIGLGLGSIVFALEWITHLCKKIFLNSRFLRKIENILF